MQSFHAEILIEKDGKLHLENLPFAEGDSVHVFVSSAKPVASQSLKGSVLKYEQPFEPVVAEDWDSAR